jgi:prevent-host-death family protein
MPAAITISIRDLHARTGHFVRKAAEMPVIVTDNGKPVAEIKRVAKDARTKKAPGSYWANRKLRPEFKKLMESGALRPKPGDKSIDEILDEVRADSTA